MEQILNALWLAIGVGLFVTIRPKSRKLQIALLCAVALLFPIISVSDDLSADRDILETIALLMPLLVAIASLIALAAVEEQRPSWRRIALPVKSDPRSPPRR